MSNISKRQCRNDQQYRAARRNSIESKEAISLNYVRNRNMMESLKSEMSHESGLSIESNEQELHELTNSPSPKPSATQDKHSSPSIQEPVLDNSSKKHGGKDINPDYIDACVASKPAFTEEWLNSDKFKSSQMNLDDDEFRKRFERTYRKSFEDIDNSRSASLVSTDSEESITGPLKIRSLVNVVSTYLQKHENKNRVIAIVLFYLAGVLFYTYDEGWSVTDSIYFITVSITTVGFGDMVPSNDASKLFTIVYVLIGLVVIFSYVNNFAESMLVYAEKQAIKFGAKNGSGENDSKQGVPYTKFRKKLIYYTCLVIVVIFLGSVFYKYNEKWSFLDAFYFSFVTTMTIGYGSPTLQESSSRIFSIFYVLFSVVIIALALGNIGAIKLAMRQEKKKFEMLNKKLDLNSIIAMDEDGDGVDRIEFLTAMLMQMNGLSKEEDIDPWLKRFDELDKDGSGRLDQEDLRLFAEEEEIRKQVRRDVREKLEEQERMGGLMKQLFGESDDEASSDGATENAENENTGGDSFV